MFFPPEQFRVFSRVIIVFCLFILFILGVFEPFPLFADYPAYINTAGLQRTRVEVLVSSMLILEYRPQAEHAQAIAVIETTLPQFEAEQTVLHSNMSPDVQSLLQQAQPGYLSIAAAAQSAINDPSKPVDPVQVTIIVSKRDAYRATMNSIVMVLVQHSEDNTRALYFIKTAIILILFVAVLFYWYVLERRMKHVIETDKLPRGKN